MTLAPGTQLPERSFGPQTRTDIVRYQGASGDFNPVHHDDEFARKGGLPGAFSVGMLQAGYLATYLVDQFGPAAVRRLTVRFVELVMPGETLTCSGHVEAVDGSAAELSLAVHHSGGGVAVSATATVSLDPGGTSR